MQAADADALERLPIDPEIVRHYGVLIDQAQPRSRLQAEQDVNRWLSQPHVWAIDVGGYVGHVRLERLNLVDQRAFIAIGIDDVRKLGQGFGTEAVRLVAAYAFGAMGLHRLTLRVMASNARAIRAYEKCGFMREGRERESARVGDDWQDDIIMGLLAREFRADIESA